MCLSVCLLAVLLVFFWWMRGGFRCVRWAGQGGERVCLECFGELASFVRWILYIEGEGVSRLRCMVMRLDCAVVVLGVALLRCNTMGVMLDWHARQAGS